MLQNNRTKRKFFSLLLILAILVVACGGNSTPEPTRAPDPTVMPTEEAMSEPTEEAMPEPTEEVMAEPTEEMMDDDMMMDDTMTDDMMQPQPLMLDGTAAGLRVVLDRLLGEHVLLAASATNAALDGRNADFEAAAASLDVNTVALSGAIEAVYGEDAGIAFLELWRTHIGFFVDYTLGVAGDDQAMQDKALEDLAGYGADFSAFLAGANPNIDPDVVEMNLQMHVDTLTAVIAAQGAGDDEVAYENLRMAYGHMMSTGAYLATAISTQFPDTFPGEAVSPAADLRAGMNHLLSEHTFLAAMATDAALDGRDDEFAAAAAVLDTNTVDLADAIGSVYGEDAGDAFLELWRTHIGFFVDYTLGVAGDDQAMKDTAIEDLLGYRADFIAFLNGANPAFTEEILSPILTPHVTSLTGVIDNQGADMPNHAYAHLREAYAHMQMIADPLTAVIADQFPEMFPAAAMMDDGMMDEGMMDVTSMTGAGDLRIALTNLLGEHVLLAASATGAALDGRNDDFEAAAGALDENSVALSAAIGSVYGEDAGISFLELWRTHIGFFVDYTLGVAGDDDAAQQQALDDLSGYGADFAAFLNGANPDVPTEAVEMNLADHVATLIAVIDAQGAGDVDATYMGLRMAFGHMQGTAAFFADAISTQFPDQFDGKAITPATDLRVALNRLLAEHTFLASMATDAALGGRDAEFEAAAVALDTNTVDLADAIASVYGDDAGDAFLELWRTHIGFFVNYTLGVAGDDQEMKDAAIEDLLGYRADFIAFLTSANEDLPADALIEILTPHVTTLTGVIEAQGADDPVTAYAGLREAYAHMQMISDALAESIVQQFPENFAQ
jgi:PBP1b-binding outer membrane lipoprotein LpoB